LLLWLLLVRPCENVILLLMTFYMKWNWIGIYYYSGTHTHTDTDKDSVFVVVCLEDRLLLKKGVRVFVVVVRCVCCV
jgi:hypothetical protein